MAFERNDNWKTHDFKTLSDFIGTRREELKGIFDKHADDNGQLKAMEADTIKEVRARHDELGDATKRWEELREMDSLFLKNRDELHKLNTEPVNRPPFMGARDADGRNGGRAVKTLGELFFESKAYKSAQGQGSFYGRHIQIDLPDFEIKTTMTTAAGFAPPNDRTDIVIPSAQAPVLIQNYIPVINTGLDAIKFMEETTFTNNAAPTAEAAQMGEAALAFTERTQPVELIGAFLPVTEQQLEVAELGRGVIDQRLLQMYGLREQIQILIGDGNTPNLQGFTTKSGIQTQAKGADSVPTAAYKLLTKLRGGGGAGFVEPSLFVFHPNDWQDIRLLQDANGNYIWGSPAEAGPERLWGKPVVQTTALTENTGLAGDFALYSALYRRRGATVSAGLSTDDFIKNKMTLKVTGRVALVIYRATAFGTLTGI